MKIQEIYNLAINKGVEADFRGREAIVKLLKRKKNMKNFRKKRKKSLIRRLWKIPIWTQGFII